MEYGITADGFSMRRLDEIYNDSCKRFEDEIGVNPSENPQSLMNVLFTIFADAPAELWEAFAASYQQLFPNTAEGIALDNARLAASTASGRRAQNIRCPVPGVRVR